MTGQRRYIAKTDLWPRRRLLSVVAAAAGMPFLPHAATAGPATRELLRWHGQALGAVSTITLAHPETRILRKTLTHCVREIRRLESLFSLFVPESEICRLNRNGRLAAPSLDLRILLAEAHRIATLTHGAFDVTVQPLWQLYRNHFQHWPEDPVGPPERAVAHARELIGYRNLEFEPGLVGFARKGMAATLNGIAQGYVTDRVAAILRAQGFERVLVDIGEIAAMAPPGKGTPWRVAVAGDNRADVSTIVVSLEDRAVATSCGRATAFDRSGRHHHLFDPSTGRSAPSHRPVTVVARSAMTADALSTALAVSSDPPVESLLRAAGAERALITDAHGQRHWFGAR